MPKRHLTKLGRFGGQFRMTIPRELIKELDWFDVEYVRMECEDGRLTVRGYIDGGKSWVEKKRDEPKGSG